MPKENSEARGMIAIINAREEVQQKAVNLIALKTPEQEGDAKVPEENSEAKGKITIINAREEGQQKAREPDRPQDPRAGGGCQGAVPPVIRQRPSRGGRRQLPGKPISQYLHLHGPD